MRNEYPRLCLDDESSVDALHVAAQILAQAQVPEELRLAFVLSKLTALRKDSGRIRGIARGHIFRR